MWIEQVISLSQLVEAYNRLNVLHSWQHCASLTLSACPPPSARLCLPSHLPLSFRHALLFPHRTCRLMPISSSCTRNFRPLAPSCR